MCREPQNRKDWGCDRDADSPVFETTCPRCSGSDDACDRCGGGGDATYLRCPQSMIDAETRALMQSYKHFKEGHLPAPGGALDQSRSFLRCVQVIDSERGVIEEERARAARERARMRE